MASSDDNPTWTQVWATCTEQLGSADEARWVVEEASGYNGASRLAVMETSAPITGVERAAELVRRRLAGEPLQYVLGTWGFRKLTLQVDRRVLIPRPETEQVVQAALDALCACAHPVVADMGTGSGAIALSFATEAPHCQVWATDESADALDVARLNAQRVLGASAAVDVHFAQGSWFQALPTELHGNVHLIVSNPPYIAQAQRPQLDAQVVEWEPHKALFSNDDGMADARYILEKSLTWLTDHGFVVLECAPQQARALQSHAQQCGYANVIIGTDFAGRERWIIARTSDA